MKTETVVGIKELTLMLAAALSMAAMVAVIALLMHGVMSL